MSKTDQLFSIVLCNFCIPHVWPIFGKKTTGLGEHKTSMVNKLSATPFAHFAKVLAVQGKMMKISAQSCKKE